MSLPNQIFVFVYLSQSAACSHQRNRPDHIREWTARLGSHSPTKRGNCAQLETFPSWGHTGGELTPAAYRPTKRTPVDGSQKRSRQWYVLVET